MKKFFFDHAKICADHGKDIADAVGYLYEIYNDGMYKWLAGLFDTELGGIYYSNSARDTDGYLPDIESTTQGLEIAQSLGVIKAKNDLPEKFAGRTLAFAKSLEDPEDGYFYHPQWGKDITVGRKGRDLDSSIGVIRALGGTPDYPTAIDRIAAARSGDAADDSTPPHLRSREAFLEFLENYDLSDHSYPKGHNLSSQRTQIKAAGLGDVCIDFINSLQRPDTALWEDKVDYESANGLLKISTLYPAFEREYPNALTAVRTEIAVTLSDEPVGGITDIYNPWIAFGILLENIRTFGGEEKYNEARALITDNAAAMIRKSKDKLGEFYKPDGSFSYLKKYSSATSQGAPAAVPHSCEGDVNATALANATRAKILEILGINVGTPFGEEDRLLFRSMIEK